AAHRVRRPAAPRADPRPEPRRDRPRAVRQPLPLHGLYEDLRSSAAGRACAPRGGGDGRREGMSAPNERKPGMQIPTGREMPKADRLRPPEWPGGRSAEPAAGFRVIGRRTRRIEGAAKVTGRAVYTDDIALPRMLHAKVLRSIHAHARIV